MPESASRACEGRIALIHALAESIVPINTAFRLHWPDAETFNVLDDALSRDLARGEGLTEDIIERVLKLVRYATDFGDQAPTTTGIVFTGTAFGPALERARALCSIPLMSPNEAAFREAAASGGSIALLVTFRPSLDLLAGELMAAIEASGSGATLEVQLVDGALPALQAGRGADHDELIAEAAVRCRADRIVLGQYSMARAAAAVQTATRRPVLTTPDSTVIALRSRLAGR